eukprot:670562-Alexandrium_andersonii.AAC.1
MRRMPGTLCSSRSPWVRQNGVASSVGRAVMEPRSRWRSAARRPRVPAGCLLYTSDAADDM